MSLYLHGESKFLDAFLAVPGPWRWLVVISFKQIPPDKEARLALLWPVFHHLKEMREFLSVNMEPQDKTKEAGL